LAALAALREANFFLAVIMPAMDWLTVSIEVKRDDAEAAERALMDAGAQSVTLTGAGDDEVLETAPEETPLWSRACLAGLFPADADPDGVRALLAATLGDAGLDAHAVALEDRDWTRAWMDRFGPMRFGRLLWIVPHGHPAPPEKQARIVRLDPGLAFGTGTHPTTRLCLEWLDANPPDDAEVIDYGCGSGVLALAAARLGARMVWCTDHDRQALTATRDNAVANGMAGRLRVVPPDDLPDIRADVLLANILHRPLLSLAPRFAGLTRAGGAIVLSGVLDGQVAELKSAYAPFFENFSVTVTEGWARVTATRLH